MTTGYEAHMYADISSIAQSLNRIANCLEAAEKRDRAAESVRAGMAAMEEQVMVTRSPPNAVHDWQKQVASRRTMLGFEDWLEELERAREEAHDRG